MNAAFENCQFATNVSSVNSQLITTDAVTKSVVKSDMAEATKMKNAVDQAKKDKTIDIMKKNLAEALNSGDEAKLKRIDTFIKEVNRQRMLSDTLGAIALIQAGKIIVDTARGGLSLSNLNNIATFTKTAKQVQSLLKTRSQLSKLLSTATAEYKKTRSITDPSKAEIEKTSKTMEAND